MGARYDELVEATSDALVEADDALTDDLGVDFARMQCANALAQVRATLALADAVHRIALAKGAH